MTYREGGSSEGKSISNQELDGREGFEGICLEIYKNKKHGGKS